MGTLQQIKIRAAVDAFIINGFNQTKAAKQLGISRGGLRQLLEQHTGVTKGISAVIVESLLQARGEQ